MKIAAFILVAALAAAPAFAQDAACKAPIAAPGFAGWSKPSGDALALGKAAALTLKPAASVHFEPRLARAPKDGTYGGYFALTVPAAGTYKVALSDKAWVDGVTKGQRLHSTAHEHGPDCSGIAKIVSFQLAAGKNYLQLSEAAKPSITVMVVKG